MRKPNSLFIIFILIVSLIGFDEAQGEQKATKEKTSTVANEILKSLEGGKRCWVIFDFKEAVMGEGSQDKYQTQFNPQDYFTVKNVSVNKVGTKVRKQRQNIFTKEWYDEYSAPLSFTVDGICSVGPNKGKKLRIADEETIFLDEWGEWHYSSLVSPSQVCSVIYKDCMKEVIKAKEAADIAGIGTILDKRTNLMWATSDIGKTPEWLDANDFCENYRAGGYTDWRLPTMDELATLIDESRDEEIRIIPQITLRSRWYGIWSRERRGGEAGAIQFGYDKKPDKRREWIDAKCSGCMSVLPVRSAGQKSAKVTRFISYSDGTVLDTSTNLMWAAKDNGQDIRAKDAENFYKNYRGGGYTDWRMPSAEELETLVDKRQSRPVKSVACSNDNVYFATKAINITCDKIWIYDPSYEQRNVTYKYAYFFLTGFTGGSDLRTEYTKEGFRCLPVRSINPNAITEEKKVEKKIIKSRKRGPE